MADQIATELMQAFRVTASQQQNTAFEAHEHPESGAQFGTLETGVLRYGRRDAQTVIFLTSGVHGAEQAAGSWC